MLRASILLAILAVAIPDRPDPMPKPPAPPVETILGDWQMINALVGGREEDPKKVADTSLVITSERILVREPNREKPEEARYVIDATKKPATIDIMPDQGGNIKVEAIYRIENGVLTLCFGRGGNSPRPMQFASEPNTEVSLLQFRRIKK